MEQLKVTVKSDVRYETYYAENIEIWDGPTSVSVVVHQPDGAYTMHRPQNIESIELVDE